MRELTRSLVRLAREHALTLNTLVQTAFGVLLGRLTGRDDVVFGVTVAGRPAELSGAERMVGLFINTLPLRMQLPPQLPLVELLQRTQGAQSALMAHQHVGLAEIQRAAGFGAGSGDLFDTLVVFENYPVDRGALAQPANGLQARPCRGPRRDALSAGADRAAGRGAAAAARLPARPVRSRHRRGLGQRLIRLLTAAVADATRPLGSLAILDEAERVDHPGGLQRHGAGAHPGHAARAVCRAGAAHARCRRGGVRGPRADLRGARRARQPPGPPPARPRRRARDRGGALRRALARDGGGPARHPQGRRAPTCRSIRTTRASGSPSCCRTPAPRCW